MNNEDKKLEGLKKALSFLDELQLPEHLQATALEYLLRGVDVGQNVANKSVALLPASLGESAGSLREFIIDLKPKGAVAEIPCLMYWAHHTDQKDSLSEKEVVELYRMSGLRPPKNVSQSLRDLCSKKYGRLEAVAGMNGYVRLSRVGEDFVLHDVKK